MARWSDVAIKPIPQEDTFFDFFPAKHVTRYLEDYVDNHIYNGQSLRQRIRFNTKVQRIARSADGHWNVNCGANISTRKLMIASGLTSTPCMPTLPGQESFSGDIIHHCDVTRSSILADSKIKHVAVLGGAKSAADMAYAAAKAGKRVSWIIREHGSGPAAMAPAKGVGPYNNSNEVLFNRFASSLNPSVWLPQTWFSHLLHATRIGRTIVESIWAHFDADVRRSADYKGHDDGMNGFSGLEPDTP